MNSKHWSWLNGMCSLHVGQSLPCQTCISSQHPDVVYDSPAEMPNPCREIFVIREDVVQKHVDLWKAGKSLRLKEPEVTAAEANEIQRRVGLLVESTPRRSAQVRLTSSNPCGEILLTNSQECSIPLPDPALARQEGESDVDYAKRLIAAEGPGLTRSLFEQQSRRQNYFNYDQIRPIGKRIAKLTCVKPTEEQIADHQRKHVTVNYERLIDRLQQYHQLQASQDAQAKPE